MVKKRLILLRGLPGSGKTTLGRQLVSESPTKDTGVLLSTNDFFPQNPNTPFSASNLDKAQRWNLKRVEICMKDSRIDLVIVDDIHGQSWEMLPYVRVALKYSYDVELVQPQNPWSLNAQLCYAASKPPRLFSEEQVVEIAARWDHALIDAESLIAIVDPSRAKKPEPVIEVRSVTPGSPQKLPTPLPEETSCYSPMGIRLTDSPSSSSSKSSPAREVYVSKLNSPKSLCELAYVAVVNYYSAEDAELLLANLFSSDQDYQDQLDFPQYEDVDAPQNFIPFSIPAKIYSQLEQYFTGSADPLPYSESQEVCCEIPEALAWQLFSYLSQGQLVNPSAISSKQPAEISSEFLRQLEKSHPPSGNLRDIMEEQMSHNSAFTRKLNSLGLNETSFRDRFRLSLQLLAEKFGSLDKQTVEEIFVENQCNFNTAYQTLCLLTSEQLTSARLTKEQEQIIADESRPSFAFAAANAAKFAPQTEEKSLRDMSLPRVQTALKPFDPKIIVRKDTGPTNAAYDRPSLLYDESRFYTQLPTSVDNRFDAENDARVEALTMRQRKRELVQMARKLHERGLHEAAAYYSNQVRALQPKLADAEQASAAEVMQRRNVNLQMQNFIDLHGLKVREALKTLDMLIDKKLGAPCQSRYLYAITGTGKHSEDGKARLRPAVVHYLRHSRKLSFTLPHTSVVKIDLLSAPTVQSAPPQYIVN